MTIIVVAARASTGGSMLGSPRAFTETVFSPALPARSRTRIRTSCQPSFSSMVVLNLPSSVRLAICPFTHTTLEPGSVYPQTVMGSVVTLDPLPSPRKSMMGRTVSTSMTKSLLRV